MEKLCFKPKKFIFWWFLGVILSSFFLFYRNPIPFLREDIWAEDGIEYIAGIINYGFWKALYLNFINKGYMQFFKFLVAVSCLEINRLFFNENILIIPRIIASLSYFIYAFIFCLPIFLFKSKIPIKYLVGIAISNCFINIGFQDNFLVFGRILNVGFLSIYLCFLLIAYRLIFLKKIPKKTLFVIDIFIFLCMITQPINIFLFLFVYIDGFTKFIAKFLNSKANLINILIKTKKRLISLFITTIGTIIYFLSIQILGLSSKSYGQTHGIPEDTQYSHKAFFGKFWFNQLFASIHENLPELLILLFVVFLITFTFILRQKLIVYCLYSLISISWMTFTWRPGLLAFMQNDPRLQTTVYTMTPNLIFIFMSFVMIAYSVEKFGSFSVNSLKIENFLLCSLLCIYVVNGLHDIIKADFEPTISLKQGLCLALNSHAEQENDLVNVPINPENWYMWLPERLVKCE